jgi:predicted nucleotidyltransferase
VTPRTPFEDRYLAEARRICLQEIPDPRYEIFLFGSRARGHCDHSSDVDIGIAGPEPLAEGVSRLMNRLLESDVPWRCQVVDFGLVADDAFRRQAYEGREVWRAAS